MAFSAAQHVDEFIYANPTTRYLQQITSHAVALVQRGHSPVLAWLLGKPAPSHLASVLTELK